MDFGTSLVSHAMEVADSIENCSSDKFESLSLLFSMDRVAKSHGIFDIEHIIRKIIGAEKFAALEWNATELECLELPSLRNIKIITSDGNVIIAGKTNTIDCEAYSLQRNFSMKFVIDQIDNLAIVHSKIKGAIKPVILLFDGPIIEDDIETELSIHHVDTCFNIQLIFSILKDRFNSDIELSLI